MGLDQLSVFGADAALAEDLTANKLQGGVCAAVRSSYGGSPYYLSPEEQRLLAQKDSLDNLTSGGLEKAFNSMLSLAQASAQNYGDDEVHGEEKADDGSASRIGAAAECFGGDLPNLLGADCYSRIGGIFKPSLRILKKRLAKRQARLEVLQDKLDSKEGNAPLITARVNQLEKSIARLQAKIKKLSVADRQVAASAQDAKVVQADEATDVSSDDDDDVPDSDDDLLAGAFGEDADLLEDGEEDDDGNDDDLEGRGGDEAKDRPAGDQMGAWFRRPLYRHRRSGARVYGPSSAPTPSASNPWEFDNQPFDGQEPDDEGEGSQAVDPLAKDPLVGFFESRAASYGATAEKMKSRITANEGDAFGGFFDAIGDFFSSIFTPKKFKARHEKPVAQAQGPVGPSWSRAEMAAIQTQLQRLGLYSSGIDGLYGPGTRSGLDKAFGSSVWMKMPASQVYGQLQARGTSSSGSTQVASVVDSTRAEASKLWESARASLNGVSPEEMFAGNPGALKAFMDAKTPADRVKVVEKYVESIVSEDPDVEDEDADLHDAVLGGDEVDELDEEAESEHDEDGLPPDDSDLMTEGD